MKIAVLGAGAWGTALAINAGAHHTVTLWARDASQAQAMQAQRTNTRYLPGQPFTAGVQVSCEPLGAWLAEQDLVVIGSPNPFGEARTLLHQGWTAYDQWLAAGRPITDNPFCRRCIPWPISPIFSAP